jgi:LPS-assembly protein
VEARELLSLLKFSFCFLLLLVDYATADLPKGIQFRADYYERDLGSNQLKGKGNAWVKSDDQEIWADEIEVDFNTNQGIARKNVRMVRRSLTLIGSRAQFNIKGPEASFENATLSIGTLVLTGDSIQRLDYGEFEVSEGTYTNCNTNLVQPSDTGECSFDWKVSGRKFRLTLEGYAHFYDVVVNAKSVPLLYTPYLILPVKSNRQSGILMPSFPFTATLGSGTLVPVYFALGSWHDLLVLPTVYTSTGLHLAFNYRYLFSDTKQGTASLTFLTRRFSDNSNPGPDDTSRNKAIGLFGEAAVKVNNVYAFSKSRSHSKQIVNYVSNPYFSFDYTGDLGARADLGNLRSQLTFTRPGDEWLFTAQAQYLQSLVVARDSGVDRGVVAQLPVVTTSKATAPLLGQWLSYEFDSQFTNFARTSPFDQLPTSPASGIVSATPDPIYLRTGRRLQLEPRLTLNAPVLSGFQFQPLLKAGTLIYNFDYPSFSVVHREYVDIEIPFGMQLSKVYETPFTDFKKISHVFQPRVVFASSLLQTEGADHPFFFRDTQSGLSNPRFDIVDQITSFQYMRFELINRFQRQNEQGGSERFFWFQISEQYNLRTSLTDPRYTTALGPIELFSALKLSSYSLQVQGSYPLQPTSTLNGQALTAPVSESFLSLGLSFQGNGRTRALLNGLYRLSADPGLNAQIGTFFFYKELPTFFDLEGYVEYNFLTRELYGYHVGFHFRSKPRSCWSLSLTTGRNGFRTQFANIGFSLDFGGFHGI